MKRYHYFYKITNIQTGQYYYGIHSTNNLEDKYFGSGTRLKTAIKKYGKNSFEKRIIKFFATRDEASDYEASVVTESLVLDKKCYNIKQGGDYGLTTGTVLVKDKNHTFHRIQRDDEEYLSGDLVPFMTGECVVFDKVENEQKIIPVKEFREESDRYESIFKDTVLVKDANNNIFRVNSDDERYLTGKLKPLWLGKKHSRTTKEKMSNSHKANSDQVGVKNSQYGTCWITNGVKNLKIKKEDLEEYVRNGWAKGRKIKEEHIKRKTDNISKADVIKLRESGLTWKSIAKQFGVGKHAMSDYRKRNNLGE